MPLALLLHNVPPMQRRCIGSRRWERFAVCPRCCRAVVLATHERSSQVRAANGRHRRRCGRRTRHGRARSCLPGPILPRFLPTAISTAVVMTAVALWFGIPAAHVPAGVAIAVASLVGFYVLRGDVSLDDVRIRTNGEGAPLGNEWPRAGSARGRARRHRLAVAPNRSARRQPHVRARHRGDRGSRAWFSSWGSASPASATPQNATWTLAIYTIAALAAAVALSRSRCRPHWLGVVAGDARAGGRLSLQLRVATRTAVDRRPPRTRDDHVASGCCAS